MQTHVIARTLVFNADHKLLLLRRCSDEVYRPGGIDLPGGKVEEDEELLDGALREALEETGLALERASTQLIYAFTRPNVNIEGRGNISAVGLFFACHSTDIDAKVNPEEHDAYYWCTLDEAIEKTDHVPHKGVFEYIRQYKVVSELWSGGQDEKDA